MGYAISIAIFCGIWAVLALSLDILTGYAGQVSLGHAAFFGIGAYVSAILTTRYEWPFLLAFAGAIVITALVGCFLGLPSLRVRHDFLVLATIGINFVVVAVFKYVDFFGGALGIINIPKPVIAGYTFRGASFLALVLLYLGLTIWVNTHLSRVWAGLAFQTVRVDEEAAEAVGVSVPRFKIYAFTISAGLAGGAGSFYAHFLGSVFPDHFAFVESIVILSMLVFGGMRTIRGPITGAVLLKAAPEYLRLVGTYRYALYGGILVLMMLFQPMGIIGEGSWLWRKWEERFGGATHLKGALHLPIRK